MDKAKALLAEAHELQEAGSRDGKHAARKEPVTERVKQAVELAPNDPDTLFMATLILELYISVFTDVARLAQEYQERLDRLGGPSDDILDIGGVSKADYERRRSSIKQTTGTGCLVTAVSSLAILVLITGLVIFSVQ